MADYLATCGEESLHYPINKRDSQITDETVCLTIPDVTPTSAFSMPVWRTIVMMTVDL